MNKIIVSLCGLAAFATGSQSLAGSVFYNAFLNFTPSPAACMAFIASGALYMEVNPGLPQTATGGETQALVTTNMSVAVINGRPGYTVVVPALNESVFCPAFCAVANENCYKACKFAVSNFYSVQKPTYVVPNGTIMVRCPNLNMLKYPNYPGDPYTKFPYTRP